MTKYRYNKLFISTYPEKIHFHPDDLRGAVDRLRTCEQLQYTKLVAETTIHPGRWHVVAPASLKLADIEGRTPAQVWSAFDAQIDEQVQYWTLRAGREIVV